jgi:tRNA 2-thiouridine synthesizing protein E
MSFPPLDQDGHLCDHQAWSPKVASQMAQAQGLILTDEHLAILFAMRDFYQRFQHAPATRPLIKFLTQQVDPTLNNTRLMALFETGLVARTLARLAGLPKPANCL